MSTTSFPLPDYATLCSKLKTHQIEGSPAELHGLFCGLFCAQPASIADGTAPLLEQPDPSHELNKLYEVIRQQFNQAAQAHQLSLTLLLPNDHTPLVERIAALIQWSHGFLAGLGEGGLKTSTIDVAELHEVLHDIADIAKLHSTTQLDAKQLTEDDEKDYAELSCYLSAAVVSIHLDILLSQKQQVQLTPISTLTH